MLGFWRFVGGSLVCFLGISRLFLSVQSRLPQRMLFRGFRAHNEFVMTFDVGLWCLEGKPERLSFLFCGAEKEETTHVFFVWCLEG